MLSCDYCHSWRWEGRGVKQELLLLAETSLSVVWFCVTVAYGIFVWKGVSVWLYIHESVRWSSRTYVTAMLWPTSAITLCTVYDWVYLSIAQSKRLQDSSLIRKTCRLQNICLLCVCGSQYSMNANIWLNTFPSVWFHKTFNLPISPAEGDGSYLGRRRLTVADYVWKKSQHGDDLVFTRVTWMVLDQKCNQLLHIAAAGKALHNW